MQVLHSVATSMASAALAFSCATGETSRPGSGVNAVPTVAEPARSLAASAGAIFWTASHSVSVDLDAQGQAVLLKGGEKNQLSAQSETVDPAPYETWEKTFQVGYAPSAAAFRTGNELYISGTLSNGDTIVERWDIPHIQGMYYSARPSLQPPASFGTPVTTPALQVGIEGGTYVVPPLRSAPAPVVSTVYTGNGLGHITALAMEPDGRFLFAIDDAGGGRLVQLRLTTPQTIHVIATDSQYPGLKHTGAPRPIDVAQVGRLYHLSIGASILWIEDPTNDGIMDQVAMLDVRSFYQAFPELGWTMVYP